MSSLTDSNRLVLGTVQLGMSYGIANTSGKPNQSLADEIVSKAWQGGIREFDTAQIYGESEIILGKSLQNLGLSDKAKIISKPSPEQSLLGKGTVELLIRESLERLKIKSFYGFMLHKEDQLSEWDEGLGEQLQKVQADGLAEYIGVSVYSTEKALQALNTEGIDIIQVPSNILDRRFERAGVFEKAAQLGKTLYVRSVFLQGLFFMPLENLPKHMIFASPFIQAVTKLASDNGLSIHELALKYAAQAYPHAKILVGAELPEQITENMEAWLGDGPEDLVNQVRHIFDSVPEKVINPVLWK
ncbi:Predicted oxidoreductase [Maridesulfovibrio ferrireducens]|uniref:Predicted oxidoreductase n=1 Tax=Maridesulfovibrio ferrireducens TaxID=246191 RepID=A0A1G9CQQ2_9BACT|nr:aldo/keto reductase [Maridesulfovibrio ferrireducens]SDK53775.1 Predicted oxidoreductase [Maridesulfovibrio ferrireducens]